MEKSIRFLGICILAAAVCISAAITVKSFVADRYFYTNDKEVFDTVTGKCYYIYADTFYISDPLSGTRWVYETNIINGE